MTDPVSRRGFLKGTAKTVGTTLLTAGLSGSKPSVPVPKLSPRNQAIKKWSPATKAYRKFLSNPQIKKSLSHMSLGGKVIKPAFTIARGAFNASITKKASPPVPVGMVRFGVRSGDIRNVAMGAGSQSSNQMSAERDVIKTARTALAGELRSARSTAEPKKVTKRGIFEGIKNRLRNIKVRGGGGKMPSSGMETAKDPTGMSLLRKYTL
jgi:hypothetical protein